MQQTKAIPFIKFHANQFQIDPAAEAFLTSLGQEKLGVISIVGKYRTGKSFFVNRVLLNQSNGFSVGPTINPCTKGLWIWNKMIDTHNPDHPDMKAIVIDTEGFGGMDENVNHDTRIFLFSLLLSSFFIYNSVGSIDENALNTISLIVNLAKEIQASQDNFFPQLLWIVRDFALQMVDAQGGALSSKEYLENALEQQKGLSDSVEQKNRIRRLIKHFFKERDCNTLVRPVEQEKDLQRLDQMNDNELRPEFMQQLQGVRSKIFRKVKPKTVQNAFLTGTQLLSLAKAYVETVNSGKVPNVDTAWGYVCKAEGEKALRECLNYGDQQIEELKSQVIPWEKMQVMKTQIFEKIKKQFKTKALGQEDDLKGFIEKMQEVFEERFKELKSVNKRNMRGHYQKIIGPYIEQIQDKLKNEEYNNYYELQSEMFKLRDKFEKEAGRTQKTQQFFDEMSLVVYQSAAEKLARKATQLSSMENKQLQLRQQQYEKDMDKQIKQHEVERNRFLEVIQQMEREKQNINANESAIRDQHDKQQKDMQQLQKQKEELQWQIQQLEQQQSGNNQKVNQQLERLRNEHQQQVSHYEKQIALLQQENLFAQKELNIMQERLVNSENENKRFRSENIQTKAMNENLQSRCNSLDTGRAQEIQKLQLEFEKKIQELNSDIDSKKQNVRMQSEWMVEKSYLENQVNFLKSQLDENKRLHDALLIALQQNGNSNDYQESTIELMETNRNLSAALDKMEMRGKQLEEKVEKLKKFKKMIKNATGITCLHCCKTMPTNGFSQHLGNCMDTSQFQMSRNSSMMNNNIHTGIISQIDLSQLQISINQTMVRETPDNKPYTEYMIRVQYSTKKWTVSRRYKNFCELHQSVVNQFPNLKLPDSSSAIINTSDIGNVFNAKRPTVIEERRKALQQYIRDLAKLDQVRNGISYKKFLELDDQQQQPENPSRSASQMGSPLADHNQGMQSSRDYGRDSISQSLGMTKQFWKQSTQQVNIGNVGPSTSRSIIRDNVNMSKQKENLPTAPFKIDRKLLPQSPQSFLKAFQKQQENSKIYRGHQQQHSLLELSESQL